MLVCCILLFWTAFNYNIVHSESLIQDKWATNKIEYFTTEVNYL